MALIKTTTGERCSKWWNVTKHDETKKHRWSLFKVFVKSFWKAGVLKRGETKYQLLKKCVFSPCVHRVSPLCLWREVSCCELWNKVQRCSQEAVGVHLKRKNGNVTNGVDDIWHVMTPSNCRIHFQGCGQRQHRPFNDQRLPAASKNHKNRHPKTCWSHLTPGPHSSVRVDRVVAL